MFNWFRKRKPAEPEIKKRSEGLLNRPDVVLQRAYWKFNVEEKQELLGRMASLNWQEKLRLHHLACLELLNTDEGRILMEGASSDTADAILKKSEAYQLCADLISQLTSPQSPYRPRHCVVWQGRDPARIDPKHPTMQGVLSNASATHIGCVEIMPVDEKFQPIRLEFVSLDEIISISSKNLAGMIVYEDGRRELALLPLLYGTSWMSDKDFLHDGSMTTFSIHWETPGTRHGLGIGFGHQDFALTDGAGPGHTLFGIGSVAMIRPALDTTDPRFEEKCRVRGIDPAQAIGQSR